MNKEQEEFFEAHNISYSIENGKTTINGPLDLRSITTLHEKALQGTTINGWLGLNSLTTLPEKALQGTTINGYLYLNSLTKKEREKAERDMKRLTEGYNTEGGYCYFDGILSKVLKKSDHKGYEIFETPFEFIAKKGEYTAHGKTIKKAIQDVEFKVIAEKLKKEPINADTMFTVKYYRLLTGACDNGVQNWMRNNNIPFKVVDGETVEEKPIAAKELLPMLEKTNAYGLDKVKQLVNFSV